MKGRSKKGHREKNITQHFLSGAMDQEEVEEQQRAGSKSHVHQQRKIEKTALMRLAEEEVSIDPEVLPIGQVIEVHSLFSQVEREGQVYLCVVRKTLTKVLETGIVVGDLVRIREGGTKDESGRPEAVIEMVMPRKTLVTRADSFKQISQHPIVANADQMLIVASLKLPDVKWGLVDRMIVAAKSGGLVPMVCLNKMDLGDEEEVEAAREVLRYYSSMGIATLESSVTNNSGIKQMRAWLKDKTTVLAGHSGVGKSSLIAVVEPGLDLKIGEISGYTGKGRHTTTSAKRYALSGGGYVIDTPGVKVFGLWGVSAENLKEYFADVEAGTAPQWRQESFERIAKSLEK